MRVLFVGGSTLTTMTARTLLRQGHDVVIIEQERDLIDTLSEELDCGFLHGDGTRPAILREANPDGIDFLFCLTGNDQNNIIASLVARSLGFKRVITKVEDEDLEHICVELGLTETIIPDAASARHLADNGARIKTGDEVVLISHRRHLPELTERWGVNERLIPDFEDLVNLSRSRWYR